MNFRHSDMKLKSVEETTEDILSRIPQRELPGIELFKAMVDSIAIEICDREVLIVQLVSELEKRNPNIEDEKHPVDAIISAWVKMRHRFGTEYLERDIARFVYETRQTEVTVLRNFLQTALSYPQKHDEACPVAQSIVEEDGTPAACCCWISEAQRAAGYKER